MPRKIENYCLGLISKLLHERCISQHTLDFLRGDPTPKMRVGKMLPVDGFFPNQKLVVEVREGQHYLDSKQYGWWNNRITATGISRKEQRKIYDLRRENILPRHGIRVLIVYDRELTFDDEADIKMLKSKISKLPSRTGR